MYKTTKILFDNNKFYSSRAAQIEDKPSNFMNGSLEIELKNISNKNNLLDDISYGSIYSVD